MSKVFYDHLVLREEITAELELHHLSAEEKDELIELIDQTLHHTTLNVILNHLPKEHHREFISKFHAAPYDEALLDYLQDKISTDIRREIADQAKKVKADLVAEINRSRIKKP